MTNDEWGSGYGLRVSGCKLYDSTAINKLKLSFRPAREVWADVPEARCVETRKLQAWYRPNLTQESSCAFLMLSVRLM